MPSRHTRAAGLPLMLPIILAGVETVMVISVGTVAIVTFTGTGGYGERIATGLTLNDSVTLLAGTIPATGLALLVQAAFEVVEWWLCRRYSDTPLR